MAQVKYVGDEPSTTVFGHTFDKDQVLRQHTLSDDHLDRLAANPQFEVSGHKTDEADEDHGPTLKEQIASNKEQANVGARLAAGRAKAAAARYAAAKPTKFKTKGAGGRAVDTGEPEHDDTVKPEKMPGMLPHDKPTFTKREADADREGF